MACVEDLRQQQTLLVAENDAAAKEKYTTIALLSKKIESYETSVASLKEALEITQTEMLETRKEEEELKNKLEMRESILGQKINDLSGLLKNTAHQIEEGEEEKSLLRSILQDQIKSMECALAENKTLRECLDSSESEKEELRSNYATAQSSIVEHDNRIGKLAKEIKNLEVEVRTAGEREDNLVNDLRLIKDENASLISSKQKLVRDRLIEELRLLNDRHLALVKERDNAASTLREANEILNDFWAQNTKLVTECDNSRLRIERLVTETTLLRKQTKNVEAEKCKSEANADAVILDLKKENSRLETQTELLQKRVESMGANEVELERAAKSNISKWEIENEALLANLTDAKGTITTLQIETDRLAKENKFLNSNVKEAKSKISTLQTEAGMVSKENVRLSAVIKEANWTISTLEKEGIVAAKDNAVSITAELQIKFDEASKKIALLTGDLDEAKSIIFNLRTQSSDVEKENSRLIANARERVSILETGANNKSKENNRLAASLREAEAIVEEDARLIMNLRDNLKEAEQTIINVKSESSEAEDQIARLIAKLKDNLVEAKETTVSLESESSEAVATLMDNLAELNKRLHALKMGRNRCSKRKLNLSLV
jgi:chromosome segregation ATPase